MELVKELPEIFEEFGQLDTRIAAFLEMIQDLECIKFKRMCHGILKKWMGF